MGDRDWYVAVVSLATLSSIGRKYGQVKVSKVDDVKRWREACHYEP